MSAFIRCGLFVLIASVAFLAEKRLEWGLVVVHVQRNVKSSLVAVLDVLGQALVMVYLLVNAHVEPFKIAVGLKGDMVLN